MPPKKLAPEPANDVRLSKKLSSLLRHRAHANGLQITADGFVSVPTLLALPQFSAISIDDISRVVASDAKQRFTLTGDRIRANQGHTLTGLCPDALLTRLSVGDASKHPICIHGTSMAAWGSIKVDGIRRMARNHVHFARGLPGDDGVLSGFRKSANVLIYVDIARALKDGIDFFLSDNGVLLSPGLFFRGNEGVVPPQYFTKAVERVSEKELL